MEEILIIIFVFALFSLFGYLRYLYETSEINEKMDKYYKEAQEYSVKQAMSYRLKKESQRKTLHVIENDLDLVYSIENHIPYKIVKGWHHACDLMDDAYKKKGKAAEDDEYEIFKTIDDKAGWLRYSEWRYTKLLSKNKNQTVSGEKLARYCDDFLKH